VPMIVGRRRRAAPGGAMPRCLGCEGAPRDLSQRLLQPEIDLPFQLSAAGPGSPLTIHGSYPDSIAAGQYFVVVRHDGRPRVIGQFTVVQANGGGTFAVRASLPSRAYTVGGHGSADGDICVYGGTFDPRDGTWSLKDVNGTITESLRASPATGFATATGAIGRR
jgi:hypothetical protein